MSAPTGSLLAYQAIAAALADLQVERLFGVLGDANLFYPDHFVRTCGGSFVAASHESGACLMALGYGLISGKVGVATVTYGAGLVNTLTPLMEGAKGGIPMILLCGDSPGGARNHKHAVPQRAFVTAAGAGFEAVGSPDGIGADLATAFRRALVERRPIVVSIPVDLQWQPAAYSPVRLSAPVLKALAPAGEDLDNAIGIIAAARRPVVLAGRGAISAPARDAVLRLAERIEAPIATTLKAKGLFDGEPFDLGVFGTLSSPATTEIALEADCLIAFGASLNADTTSKGAFVCDKRIVHVDCSAGALGRYVTADAALFGDVELVAKNLLHWLDEAEIPGSGYRSDDLRARLEHAAPDDARFEGGPGTVDIRRTLAALDSALPADRIVVNDAGRHVFESWRNLRAAGPASLINTNNCGSIGLSLSHGIGAAFAAEGRPVVVVCGDGGFMHGCLAEFNTAVRYGCDLIVLVCNDGSYGAEYVQYQSRDFDPSISLFEWPEFAEVANALGGQGVTVECDADLEIAISAINSRTGPILVDIKTNPASMPNHSR